MDSHKLLVEDMSSSSMLENQHIKTLCQIYHTTAFTSYYKQLQVVKYGIVCKPWSFLYSF